MKNLLLVTLITFSNFAFAEEVKVQDFKKSFTRKIDIPGVGSAKINYSYRGEPLAFPARLNISVKCDNMKAEVKVPEIDLCSLNKYNYQQSNKTLSIDFQYARVDFSSRVFCDQQELKSFDLADICRKAWGKIIPTLDDQQKKRQID